MRRIDHYLNPDAPLLIRRSDNGLFSIPGGALDLGETLTETVRREVLEETGIAVDVIGLIGVYSDPAHVIEFTNGEVRAVGELETLDIPSSIRLRIRHGLARRVEPFYS